MIINTQFYTKDRPRVFYGTRCRPKVPVMRLVLLAAVDTNTKSRRVYCNITQS